MNILTVIPVAWRALMRHKLRSALTALGIIIGVASVIAMIAIGSGARAMIRQQVSSLGINQIMIFPGSSRSGAVRGGMGSISTFTVADARAVAAECPAIRHCSPLVRYGGRTIAGNLNWPTRVMGVYPCYLAIRNWGVTNGAAFTDYDEQRAAKVCLIGQTVVENLFPDGGDPVGAIIRIGTTPFHVLGVLGEKGLTPWGEDQDDQVLAPFSTVQRRLLNIDHVQSIQCSAISAEAIYDAQEQVTALLRQRHRIPQGEEDDFVIRNQADLLKAQSASSDIMQILLGSIASISLIVGGIGIMNIMLVSVTERTREIGIRMAVGARAKAILTQFLVEAVILALLGGAIGVFLGVGTAKVIALVLKWPTLISPAA
ncbi:FtsX-like permease family protein, partial [bacterium]|nr:FtsX-like permease family protein [bacterium]